MATIPTAQALTDAGIDSLERLVIALGLHFAHDTGILPKTSPIFEAVSFKITERTQSVNNVVVPYITADFECYFQLETDARLEAGLLLQNIAPFLQTDAPTLPVSAPSLVNAPALPTIPEELTTAEQLMVWGILVLNASLYPNGRNYIQISPLYEDNELKVKFQFPLDAHATFLSGYQLIGAVQRIVGDYVDLETGAVAQIGLNAYDVAVANGYLGTAVEWLASLVGPPGADSTVPGPQGEPGADGAPGLDGVDGKTAYELAVDAGFVGTLEEWVAGFGTVGINMGEWDDGETFTTGIRFDGNAKVFYPITTTEARLAQVLQPGEAVYDTEVQRLYYGNGVTPGGLSIQSQADLDIDWSTAQVNMPLVWDGTRLVFLDPLGALGLGDITLPLAVSALSAYPTTIPQAEEAEVTFRVALSKASNADTAISYRLEAFEFEENGLIVVPASSIYGTTTFAYVPAEGTGGTDITLTITGAFNGDVEIPFPQAPVSVEVEALPDNADFAVPVTVTVSPGSTLEYGGSPLVFTVELGQAQADQAVTVTYALSGSAVEGTDYPAIPDKSLIIPAQETTGTVTITPLDNEADPGDRTVILTLTGSTLGEPPNLLQATATISDVDFEVLAPTVSPSSVSENGGVLVFTVSQSKVSAYDTTISYSLTGTAVEGTDYQAIPVQEVTIPAGSTTATVSITAIDNDNDEPNRTVILTQTGATNNGNAVTYSTTAATGTINDDDIALSISAPTVSPASVNADSGTGVIFTITQNRISVNSTTISYSLTGTAVEGTDYQAIGTKTAIIPAGQTTATVTVTPIDRVIAGSGTVILTQTGATNNGNAVTYSTTAATGTVVQRPFVATPTVSPSSVSENGGVLVFTFNQPRISAYDTTIGYSLTGTAVEGTDYQAIPVQEVTIPAGSTTATVSITAINNDNDEPNRTVILTQTGATNNGNAVTYSTTAVTGTINDDDIVLDVLAPTVSPSSVSEAGGVLVFSFSQNRTSVYDTVIAYSLAGTAAEGTDYQAIADKTVTIPAGQTTATLSITAIDNATYSGSQTIILTQTGATNNGAAVTYSTAGVTGTITDNEVSIGVYDPKGRLNGVDKTTWYEDDGIVYIVFNLNRLSVGETYLDYSLTGTAVQGVDYTSASSGTITVPNGYSGESLLITLTGPGNYSSSYVSIIITITAMSNQYGNNVYLVGDGSGSVSIILP